MKPTNPVDEYALAVVGGQIPAGKYHRLSCARHLRDMSRQGTSEFPYRFVWEERDSRGNLKPCALRYVKFAEQLKHYKGEWAGQYIRLEPHQKFRKGSKYGWVHVETGLRRFRNSYEEIPRKNGKTLELATETLYLTFFDGEAGAEGYVAATKREQALIIFNDCKKLVQSSGLKDRLTVQVSNIHSDKTSSKLEPLSADYNTMDGLNVHVYTLDEMHALKTRGVVDVIETATGARRQPFGNKITTAGDDPVSPCGDEHNYACQILEGILVDETYFCFIAHADLEDDWTLESTARKANPNFGVSVKPEDLAAKVVKAKGIPEAAATYKQKHLNLWVNSRQPWLSLEGWQKGQSSPDAWSADDLLHESCYVGIDLASKLDLTAMVFAFPPTPGRRQWRLLRWVWTPEDTIIERSRRDRAPYDIWHDDGYLYTTPGTRIDNQVIREVLRVQRTRFDIERIGFDPWHADGLIDQLIKEDGFDQDQVLSVSQTYKELGSACERFEADVLAGDVDAQSDPLMRWCVSNAVVVRDGKNNMFPVKKKSRGRIDPVMATLDAVALYLRQPVNAEPTYNMVLL